MNDSRITAIAIIFVAALGPIMYSNSRITDLRNDVGKRFDNVGKCIDDLRDSVNRHIDDKFNLLSQQIKHMEDNAMRILGDHETRIQNLEKGK